MKEIVYCLDSSINTIDEIIYFIRENKINIPSGIIERLKKNFVTTIFYEKESKRFFGWSGHSYNHVIKDLTSSHRTFELIKINKNTEIWYD